MLKARMLVVGLCIVALLGAVVVPRMVADVPKVPAAPSGNAAFKYTESSRPDGVRTWLEVSPELSDWGALQVTAYVGVGEKNLSVAQSYLDPAMDDGSFIWLEKDRVLVLGEYVVDTNTLTATRIESPLAQVYHYAVSPDQKRIALKGALADGNKALVLYDVDAGSSQVIYNYRAEDWGEASFEGELGLTWIGTSTILFGDAEASKPVVRAADVKSGEVSIWQREASRPVADPTGKYVALVARGSFVDNSTPPRQLVLDVTANSTIEIPMGFVTWDSNGEALSVTYGKTITAGRLKSGHFEETYLIEATGIPGSVHMDAGALQYEDISISGNRVLRVTERSAK